jgi:hypothetical protein
VIDTLVAMTPLKAAVADAIEDLKHREAILAEREAHWNDGKNDGLGRAERGERRVVGPARPGAPLGS